MVAVDVKDPVDSLEKPQLFLRMRAFKEKLLKELEETGKLAKTMFDEYLCEKAVRLWWFELEVQGFAIFLRMRS